MLQRTTQLVMLVLSSLGGVPLWLHEGLCHHPACESASACSVAAPSCCDNANPNGGGASDCNVDPNCDIDPNCSAESRRPISSDQNLVVHEDHDCWVCFQLSQSQSLSLAHAGVSIASLLATCLPLESQVTLSTVECPPPARGPPVWILV